MRRWTNVLLVLLVLAPLMIGLTNAPPASAWSNIRVACDTHEQKLSAEFQDWSGTPTTTFATPPGVLLYQKLLTVPSNCDTLEIVMSATGQVLRTIAPINDVSAALFECDVDGTLCNSGFTSATSTNPGWIVLLSSVSFTDQGVHYTWCTPITPGDHAINIRLASIDGVNAVSVEGEYFYILASKTSGGCNQSTPPPAALVPAPTAATTGSTIPIVLPPLPPPPSLP